MALQQSIKAPRKQAAKARDPMYSDEKYTGREPVWDTERALKMTQDEFDHFLRKSFTYYNYYFAQKDLKKHMVKWMQENGYGKPDVSAFIRSPDRALPMTVYGLLMSHRQGMPFREKELKYVKEQIASALAQADGDVVESATGAAMPAAEKSVVKVVTIQDRLNEKTSEHLAHFEGLYDDVVTGSTVDPKAFDYLTVNTVPQSQINKFVDLISARKAELGAAQGKLFEDHVESYRHYKAADYKRHHAFLDAILDALEQYRGVKKTMKKIRAKKLPSKEKLVSKMKYAKDYATLKLMSISPADIIGATALWVYNTKTRKMGVYRADTLTGPLGVKGTTIIGFDTAKSIAKTLRRPEDQLKEFQKAGKVALRKYIDDIRATETKLTGRINEDTILLKVE